MLLPLQSLANKVHSVLAYVRMAYAWVMRI